MFRDEEKDVTDRTEPRCLPGMHLSMGLPAEQQSLSTRTCASKTGAKG